MEYSPLPFWLKRARWHRAGRPSLEPGAWPVGSSWPESSPPGRGLCGPRGLLARLWVNGSGHPVHFSDPVAGPGPPPLSRLRAGSIHTLRFFGVVSVACSFLPSVAEDDGQPRKIPALGSRGGHREFFKHLAVARCVSPRFIFFVLYLHLCDLS